MTLPSILTQTDFWSTLSQTRHRLLGLDYDGTLAPFKVERMAALPHPGAVEALRAIRDQAGTTIAIISGRRAEEVVQLLGDPGLTVVGSHGYEWRDPRGATVRRPLRPGQQRRLQEAYRQVEAIGLAERLERKTASLAFHTRGLPIDEATRLEAQITQLWSPGADEHGLRCGPFDGGIELRAVGIDKGSVLVELLERQPPDALAVYLGDDRTDEDAFRILRRFGGIGIKVGRVTAPTAARAHLADCREVVTFLDRWLETTGPRA